MAQPKRKTSKMKKRIRKAVNVYKGIQVVFDPITGEATLPHRINPTTGEYKGRQYTKAIAE